MPVQFNSMVPSQTGVSRRSDNPNMYYRQGVDAFQDGTEAFLGADLTGNTNQDNPGTMRGRNGDVRPRGYSLAGRVGDVLEIGGSRETDGGYIEVEAPPVIPGQAQPTVVSVS